MAYDENQWASALNCHGRSVEDALDLFKWLRRQNYQLIESLPEAAWSNSGYHPENGDMTLDDWLDGYERHVPEHLQYMQENYAVWRRRE